MLKLLSSILNGGDAQNVATLPFDKEEPSEEITIQQMSFADSSAGEATAFASSTVSPFDSVAISGLDLGDYLSRPVLIDTFSWLEGGFFAHNFDPWLRFYADPIIKKKVDNYGLLRSNLRLKFIISASPFYYGLGLISYNPFPESHPAGAIAIGSDEGLVNDSQKPHIYIHPETNSGGEMTLPFFYPFPWLENEFFKLRDMGTIRYDSPTRLRNANSVAGANVTVRCYAWAENVELSAPTMVLQAKRSKKVSRKSKKTSFSDNMSRFSAGRDEYGSGPVSNIASAVANAGAALSNVPMIGPFARATEIGAGALSRVASWFGYTNLPVIDNVSPYKDLPFGGVASSEIGAPTPKLTLDPKNELTLDSRTVGLDGTDELALESFLSHESYLTSFTWDTAAISDEKLWVCAVSPAQMYRRKDTIIYPTPLSHACSMYQYWTGSVIYRFRIVCTAYHRGRIKITYEPNNTFNNITGSLSETALVTRIYDIGETTDIEICVPYMQANAFQPNVPITSTVADVFSSSPSTLTGSLGFNGYLTVSVANDLTSPVADAPVDICVFVRAGDDFKLMGPRGPPQDLQWISQSAVTPKCDSLFDVDQEEPMVNLVYGGETALSFRQLMHRHNYIRSFSVNPTSPADYYSLFHMYPESANYSNDVRNIHVGISGRVNFVVNNYIGWISPCFAGRRGSMYWAVNSSGVEQQSRLTFWRELINKLLPGNYDALYFIDSSSASAKSRQALLYPGSRSAAAGMALYNAATQIGATVLMPFISNRRFVGTWPSAFKTSTQTRDGVDQCTMGFKSAVGTSATNAMSTGEMYCATGPDFNLFFFTGVPSLRFDSTLPALPLAAAVQLDVIKEVNP